MTRTTRTLKGLLALLVSLTMVMALSASLFASAATTVTETVVVQQTVTPNTTPKRNTYTYVLTPRRAENPMPDGTIDGQYTILAVKGTTTDETAPSFTFEIDLSKPGVYEYILEKVETTPEGDTFSPEIHIFGYKVEVDEKTGELVAIPYICQSGEPIFSDPDENGYPTKLTLQNVITGPKNTTKPSTTTTTKKGYTTRTYSTRTVTRATYVTTARGGRVNTGDESQILLWVTILAVASLGLIILILARRRNDDDDDEKTL